MATEYDQNGPSIPLGHMFYKNRYALLDLKIKIKIYPFNHFIIFYPAKYRKGHYLTDVLVNQTFELKI